MCNVKFASDQAVPGNEKITYLCLLAKLQRHFLKYSFYRILNCQEASSLKSVIFHKKRKYGVRCHLAKEVSMNSV